MPASLIPYLAKKNGAKCIEINIEPSNYSNIIVDVFLRGNASQKLAKLKSLIV